MNDTGLAGLMFIFIGCCCLFISAKIEGKALQVTSFSQWPDKMKACVSASGSELLCLRKTTDSNAAEWPRWISEFKPEFNKLHPERPME